MTVTIVRGLTSIAFFIAQSEAVSVQVSIPCRPTPERPPADAADRLMAAQALLSAAAALMATP